MNAVKIAMIGISKLLRENQLHENLVEGLLHFAEKWKQRAEVEDEHPSTPRTSPPIIPATKPVPRLI